MNHKTHFVFLFFLMFLVLTALFSFIFVYEYLLLYAPLVSASPPTLHQFYGDVKWANGSIAYNVSIEARHNTDIVASYYSQDGEYGYSPLFTVENLDDGDIISFYLNSVKAGDYTFDNFGFTNLNLQMQDICGDNFCGNDESCHNCPQDCGECTINNDNSNGGGGGGSGGGSGIAPTKNSQADNSNNAVINNNSIPENAKAPPANASNLSGSNTITGNVIADQFFSNKLFIPVVSILLILFILIIIEIIAVRRRHLAVAAVYKR